MKTFKIGGIHPPSYKYSENKPIVKVPLPKQAVIPLSQHLGKPALPIVEKGDVVKVGQLIAKADGFMSANIHASVSGTVLKIDEVMTTAGYRLPAVFIEVQGDVWESNIDKKEDLNVSCMLESEQIIEKIQSMGIVGLGGATFPAHVKLQVPKGKKANLLIVNAAECEPYLTCDHQLMNEKAREILYGVHILMKALKVTEAVIGIESNKKDVIDTFQTLSTRVLGVDVVALKEQYPQGGERQMIEAVTGRRVPSGKLPVDIGVVVVNVATAFAVYQGVMKNKPLIERVLTVTGKHLENPTNLLVRIGTPFADLVEFVGGLPFDTEKIIAGGPMMGRAIADLSIPVTKGSSGLVFVSSGEARRKEIDNCTRCAKCVEACPMGLEPYLLMSLAENALWEKMEQSYIMDCIECGCCLYSCPSNRPLLDYVRYGKKTVGDIIRNR